MRQSYLLSAVAGVSFALATLSTGSQALAQAASCECVVPVTALPTTGPIGQVMDVSGNNVMLTGPEGPTPAAEGAPIHLGDQLTVGPQSSASFSIGNCALGLSAQTQMSLQTINGNLCVAVAEAAAPAPVLGQNAPLALFGTIAAGNALIAVFDRGDDVPVSP